MNGNAFFSHHLTLKKMPLFQASVTTVQLWVSGILAVIRVLVSQSTEDIVLSRVQELSLSPLLLSCHTIHNLHQSPSYTDPPFCYQEANVETQKAQPEETFARLVIIFTDWLSLKTQGVNYVSFLTCASFHISIKMSHFHLPLGFFCSL